MSFPVVRYNNFIKIGNALCVDCVSKFLLMIQFVFGLNRIAVLGITKLYLASSIFYSITLISFIITFGYVFYPYSRDDITGYIKLSKYLANCLLGTLTWKRLERYYRELNKIDEVVGYRPDNKRDSINLAIQMVSIICLLGVNLYEWSCPQYAPVSIIHIVENYYYTHLTILLTRRLRMLNFILETSLANKGMSRHDDGICLVPYKHVEATNVGICEIMEAYYVIIDASELLSDAIKWQLLLMISVTFITTLLWSYWIALVFLQGSWTLPLSFVSLMSIVVTELFPLAMPCIACDGVRAQVGRLREVLSSKLHETKLDKSNRNITRALLALTETHNLSFSLFRMVDISISLPFSFLGLLLTYLIILLQFQKVQNT